MHHRIVVHGALLAFLLCPFTGAELRNLPTKEPLWEPLKDEVYLQEVSSAIATSTPLTSVEVYRDKVYAGAENGLFEVVGTELRPVSAIEGAILRLRVFTDQIWAATSARAEHEFGWNKVVVGDQLWIATSAGLWRNDDRGWIKVAAGKVLDMCLFRDEVVFLSENQLFRVTKTGPEPLTQQGHATLLGVTPYAGTLYVHDGKRIGLLQNGEISFDYIADWGHLEPGVTTRDIFGRGSRLYVATNEGLGVLRGMTWYMSRGEDGLCYEDTTCIVPGFDNDLWIGTMRGAIRNVGEEYQFFGHARWIPHDQVNAIASGDKVVYIATNGGLGIITYEPYTLAKKAAYYERWLEEWGQKRLGFVHSINLVNGEWLREVSDNDVGFSSHYVSAKCFEYAVTGSKQARAEAVDMMKSVKWSEEITGIEGFPARSIYNVGETTLKAMHGSGGLPAEWHATPDGIWEWNTCMRLPIS
ncbi:MAG: hypothetical protein HYV26_07990 [Candidatus Hydrogenedentes bacterium]|nr:hypothetical protein [Candidatus Hydrogenedentota bacterium]